MVNMENLMCLLALIGSLAITNVKATASTAPTYQNLKTIGERYIAFLQKIGRLDSSITREEVSQLFASECKKIVNGSILFTSSNVLSEQLNTARNATGGWNIKILLLTASQEDRTCTIQIEWEGAKMERHTTMMILFMDDAGKISQIHEVYNEFKDSKISEAYNDFKKNSQ